jgi:ribosomal protein S18 acetylase RimI-like enzyme
VNAIELSRRGRAWRHGAHDAVCDVIEPWEHGTIVRASRYPTYYDFNLVRVEDDPGMSVDELIAVADGALSGLAHRRFDFELVEAAEPLRAEFKAAGWKTLRLLWMHHESPPPPGPEIAVEAVPYDAVHDLRVAWHDEDFPGVNPASYHVAAREVALRRGAQVLAVYEDGVPVAFAQLERDGDAAAEITQVYVHPDHRGGGRGTAMTRAAIEAAAGARDLWIAADDEDRPKELYARLGFRPVWTAMEVTLWPS